MFALFSRILKLSGRYKGRIQGAFVCAFLESILSKMPIFLAFVILSGFAAGTLTSQTCLMWALVLLRLCLYRCSYTILAYRLFLWGFPKGATPHLAHDFAKQSVVCYTLCRRCRENVVAAGEGKGI